MTRRISNSEIEDVRRCARKHWLGHVRKLEPVDPPNPLKASELGNVVHEALQAYYLGRSAHLVLRDLIDARDGCEPGTDAYKAADMVLAVIEGYFDHLAETGIDQEIEWLAVEQVYERDLPGLAVTLVCKVDALVRLHTGQRVPLDHKSTGYQLAQRVPYLKRKTQVSHYLWVLDSDVHAREMVLNVLRQSKRTETSRGPFYERVTATRNTEELRAYEDQAREWGQQILDADERTTVPPPSPGDDCSWACPFFSICPSFDNGDDIDHLLSENYRPGDPMARYAEED